MTERRVHTARAAALKTRVVVDVGAPNPNDGLAAETIMMVKQHLAMDDLMKCRLKPANPADYAPALPAPVDLTRLASLFPLGGCDYSKPGVEQVPLKGIWLSY